MSRKHRRKKNQKLTAIIIALLLLSFAYQGLFGESDAGNASQALSEAYIDVEPINPEGTASITFLDVGQALSVLVECNSHYMLYDTGNADDIGILSSYFNDQGIDHFDLIVGSHPHEDHIGCLAEVLEEYETDLLWMPDQEATSKCYENSIQVVEEKGIRKEQPAVGSSIDMGGMEIVVLGPNRDYEDINNDSIVLLLSYGENKVLLTGDSSSEAEADMVANGLPEVDLLLVGHHGSSTASSYTFLRQINPYYAVISCGLNNEYGHPHEEPLSRLDDIGATIYRTDQLGSITAFLDGNDISFDKSGTPASHPHTDGSGLGSILFR